MRIKGIKIDEDVARILNEQDNDFPEGSFAEWFGKDLTGQKYNGNINCFKGRLTSLYGAPQEVGGDFYCRVNNLTSLNGIGEVKGKIISDI